MPAPTLLFAGAALAVAVTCESAPGAGRVRCEARVEPTPTAGSGTRGAAALEISWADLVVVKTAPFLTALRGRLAPGEASERTASRWTFAFALVARERGSGDVVVRARAVVCRAGGVACAPVEQEASAEVRRE